MIIKGSVIKNSNKNSNASTGTIIKRNYLERKAGGSKTGPIFHVEEFDFDYFSPVENLKEGKPIDFEFKRFNEYQDAKEDAIKNDVLNEMHQFQESGFIVSPIVERFRGFRKHQEEEIRKKFDVEVEERVESIKAQYVQLGYTEGKEAAYEEVFKDNALKIHDKLNVLGTMFEEALKDRQFILEKNKKQIVTLMKSLVKWVIHRELKNDQEYLSRIISRMISEIDNRENVVIRINKTQFEDMPEILKIIQNRFSDLKNLRVEIDEDLTMNGVVIENSESILDGTLETQFSVLDKIFDGVLKE